ncbi:MAG TPA: response regulator [Pyrinomonadaceae bacterium]|nr:response regulator [Pyrinomonadaceae bacterium]
MSETQTEDLKVLVVEDYEDASLAMRLALEDQGYRIVEASDGRRAVELAASERPRVILMDLELPILDGLTAAAHIRANPDLSDAVIIAVTAHNDPDHRARALAAGCNAFVSKPIDFDWLNNLILDLTA